MIEQAPARKLSPPPKPKREPVLKLVHTPPRPDGFVKEEAVTEDDFVNDDLLFGRDSSTQIEKREKPAFLIAETSEASPDHPEQNEDTLFSDAKRGIFAVADGMGGLPAGDKASQSAINQLNPDVIEETLIDAETAEDISKATIVSNVFNAPADKALTQNEVESAMRIMTDRMHSAVEQVQTLDEMKKDAKRFEKAKQIWKETWNSKGEDKDFDENSATDVTRMNMLLQMIATTATVSKFWKNESGEQQLTVSQIGDSRMYRFRDGQLEPLTKDQSMLQGLVDNGIMPEDADVNAVFTLEQIKPFADKDARIRMLVNMMESDGKTEEKVKTIRRMTTAVGGRKIMKEKFNIDVEPDVETHATKPGDVFLICSDGVHDNLSNDEIEEIIKSNKGLNVIANAIEEKARQRMMGVDKSDRAKKDDVTVQFIIQA